MFNSPSKIGRSKFDSTASTERTLSNITKKRMRTATTWSSTTKRSTQSGRNILQTAIMVVEADADGYIDDLIDDDLSESI